MNGDAVGDVPMECRAGLRLLPLALLRCGLLVLPVTLPLGTLTSDSFTSGAEEDTADIRGLRLWLLAVRIGGTWNLDVVAAEAATVSPPAPDVTNA